jgi:hypothetical protein
MGLPRRLRPLQTIFQGGCNTFNLRFLFEPLALLLPSFSGSVNVDDFMKNPLFTESS